LHCHQNQHDQFHPTSSNISQNSSKETILPELSWDAWGCLATSSSKTSLQIVPGIWTHEILLLITLVASLLWGAKPLRKASCLTSPPLYSSQNASSRNWGVVTKHYSNASKPAKIEQYWIWTYMNGKSPLTYRMGPPVVSWFINHYNHISYNPH
jgi:hypothetical protein